ncbi:MAG: hypothetical protein CMC53_03525 [Flavobacteriaceae bacterium]|nr:hypothetical protein [Flavobacteriaceae bacterium]|tara:strand:+ start:2617 stop:2802 length:186 start_codon:yes stop_codon:yes gene_type:complete
MPRFVYSYTIKILRKVSFNAELFKKEIEKASHKLLPHEFNELMIWVKLYVQNKPNLQGLVF